MTHTASVTDHAENHTYHQPTDQTPTSLQEPPMFDDPISSNELLEAAREYARAVALAKDTAAAAHEADIRLTEADIAAVIAINNEWEANLNNEQGPPRREMGFVAEVNTPRDPDDLAAAARDAEFAKLHYQQKRAVAMSTDLAATSASQAAEAAEKHLLDIAKTPTTGPVDQPAEAPTTDQVEVTV